MFILLSHCNIVNCTAQLNTFYIYRWGELDVMSGTGQNGYSDQTIMFAAGYLEGALTAK